MDIYEEDYVYVALYKGSSGVNLKASEYDMALTHMGNPEVAEFIGLFGDIQHIRGTAIDRVVFWGKDATARYNEQREWEKIHSDGE